MKMMNDDEDDDTPNVMIISRSMNMMTNRFNSIRFDL